MPVNSNGNYYLYVENDKITIKSLSGEDISSVDIPNSTGTRYTIYNDEIYLLSGIYNNNNDGTYDISFNLSKYNENLELLNTTLLESFTTYNGQIPEEGLDESIYNIYINDNKVQIYILGSSYNYYNISSDLFLSGNSGSDPYYKSKLYQSLNGGYNFNEFNESGATISLHNLIMENSLSTENKDPSYYYEYYNSKTYNINDKNYVIATNRKNNGNTYYYKQQLMIFDSNLRLIANKDLTDWHEENRYGEEYISTFNGNIIVALNGDFDPILSIYDQEGNLVKDLSPSILKYKYHNFTGIRVSDYGFYIKYDLGYYRENQEKGVSTLVNGMVLDVEEKIKVLPLQMTVEVPGGYWDNDNYNFDKIDNYTALLYFSLNYNVETKTSGKGSITATPDKAEEGEPVTFKVTPEPGYVLSYVKVIDANGNVVTFTNNTFVMPSSDVTIEATFVAINPNTNSFITYTILGICAAAGLLTVFLSSKKKQYE